MIEVLGVVVVTLFVGVIVWLNALPSSKVSGCLTRQTTTPTPLTQEFQAS